MDKALTYEKCHIDEKDIEPFIPGLGIKVYFEPEDKRLACVLVKYDVGFVLKDWCLYHSEVYIVQRGSARVSVSFAPAFNEIKEFEVGPGDIFYFPLGTKLTFEVTSKEPWVYLAVAVPSFTKL